MAAWILATLEEAIARTSVGHLLCGSFFECTGWTLWPHRATADELKVVLVTNDLEPLIWDFDLDPITSRLAREHKN